MNDWIYQITLGPGQIYPSTLEYGNFTSESQAIEAARAHFFYFGACTVTPASSSLTWNMTSHIDACSGWGTQPRIHPWFQIEESNSTDFVLTGTQSKPWAPNCTDSFADVACVLRSRQLTCPEGWFAGGDGSRCYPYQPVIREKNHSPMCPDNRTNPVHTALGTKLQTEVDYNGAQLTFQRRYSSSGRWRRSDFGAFWRHNFSRHLIHVTTPTIETVDVYRNDGGVVAFNKFPDSRWVPDPDVTARLEQITAATGETTGWRFIDADESVEVYGPNGQLLRVTDRSGYLQDLAHDGLGRLASVADSLGRQLSFTYDPKDRIATMSDPAGNVFEYGYDSSGNLIQVRYPDSTTRQYLYEDSRFINTLTGILDENGNRYATWTYDAQGRAISSEHAGGADRATLTYNANGTTTVTNALGKQTTYHFDVIHGVYKVTQVEGHPSANCAGANQAYSYDANGFLASKTDWNGNLTTYLHDVRGLELSRTEAAGTAQARTITTEWHAEFRLPVRITEPGRITEFTYDGEGRLLSRAERTTP